MKGLNHEARTPEDYIAALEEPRRSDIARLDKLIRKTAPRLKPAICAGMLGYGLFHYKYASGREGDTCKLSIASNKQYISLYAFASDEKGYVAERFKKKLAKASIGKSCVRFKKLEDLDLDALAELIKVTAKTGLAGL
jgi:hypothetical protein